jgi:SnoaL-like domain
MPARSPEEICRLFERYMAEGDIEAVLSLYDPRAVFLNEAAEVTSGRQHLREQLAPLVAAKARFEFDIRTIYVLVDDQKRYVDVEARDS